MLPTFILSMRLTPFTRNVISNFFFSLQTRSLFFQKHEKKKLIKYKLLADFTDGTHKRKMAAHTLKMLESNRFVRLIKSLRI